HGGSIDFCEQVAREIRLPICRERCANRIKMKSIAIALEPIFERIAAINEYLLRLDAETVDSRIVENPHDLAVLIASAHSVGFHGSTKARRPRLLFAARQHSGKSQR